MRLRCALLTVLVLLGVAGEAQASRRVHVGRLVLAWPDAVARGSVVPGSRVVVRAVGGRGRATVSLVRVSGLRRVVSRKRLRPGGSFRARVVTEAGTRYLLRARAGRHRHRSRFSLSAAQARARLVLGATSGHAGDRVGVTLSNTGPANLFSGCSLDKWEARQADGSYLPVAPPGPFTQEGCTFLPGARVSLIGTVWSNLAPGVYRAVKLVSAGKRIFDVRSADFAVT